MRCIPLRPALLWALTLLAMAGPATAGPRAGVAAAVRGHVTLDRGRRVGVELASGDPIHLGDVIHTGTQGGLQILLLDETVFTLGPESRMVVDEFVYDPEQRGGQVGVRLLEGVFRFVTGKVARDEPENVELRLPVGSIGIRGTIGGARVGDQESVVGLLGPGPLNDADERIGGLRVRTPAGTRELVSVGWGVRIPREGPPSLHFRVAEETFLTAMAPVRPGATGRPGKERPASRPARWGAHSSASQAPGSAPARPPANPAEAADAVRAGARHDLQAPARVARREMALQDLEPAGLRTDDASVLPMLVAGFGTPPALPDGITQVQQLVQHAELFQGTFRWEQTGAQLNAPDNGFFDAKVVLDFAQQDLVFRFENFSSTTFLTTGSGNPVVEVRPFSSGKAGEARFLVSGSYSELPSTLCLPCTVRLDATFRNRNGKVARDGRFLIVITDGAKTATAGPLQGPPTLILP